MRKSFIGKAAVLIVVLLLLTVGGLQVGKISIQRMSKPAVTPDFVNQQGTAFRLIRPGTFIKSRNNGSRTIHLTQPFYMGINEVTVGEFKRFIDATGYVSLRETNNSDELFYDRPSGEFISKRSEVQWQHPGFNQTDNHPVVGLCAMDAMAYVKWLNRTHKIKEKSGESWYYTLPSSAMWEYACRGGTTTKYFWGDSPEGGRGYLNGPNLAYFPNNAQALNFDDGYAQTAPVRTFRPNPFGLYDMLGNVDEYCLDSFPQTLSDTDPLANRQEISSRRIQRGGSWAFLFSSGQWTDDFEGVYNDDFCGGNNSNGFRLAIVKRTSLPVKPTGFYECDIKGPFREKKHITLTEKEGNFYYIDQFVSIHCYAWKVTEGPVYDTFAIYYGQPHKRPLKKRVSTTLLFYNANNEMIDWSEESISSKDPTCIHEIQLLRGTEVKDVAKVTVIFSLVDEESSPVNNENNHESEREVLFHKEAMLFHAIANKNKEEVIRLLESGVNLEVTDSVGRTPLIFAVRCNEWEIIKILLNAEYDLYRQGKLSKNIMLHCAVRTGDKEKIRILVIDLGFLYCI